MGPDGRRCFCLLSWVLMRAGPCGGARPRCQLPRASHLERLRVSPAYRHTLNLGLELFTYWETIYGAVDFAIPCDLIDERLKRFVNEAHAEGCKFHVVRAAVLGIQHRAPRLRHELPGTWHALGGWASTLEWTPRVPFPASVLLYAFLVSLQMAMGAGSGSLSRRWATVGCLLRLAFFALLRPGEALKLRPADLHFGTDPSGAPVLIVAIKAPKTRRVIGAGRNQSVLVKDLGTVLWLRYIVIGLDPSKPLWGLSQGAFRQHFLSLMKYAGLTKGCFTPASCRAGGATEMYVSGVSMEILAFRGRWMSLPSLRSYLQEGTAVLVWNRLAREVQARCKLAVVRFSFILERPPPSFAIWPEQWCLRLNALTDGRARRPPPS
jgi:hypothetical protein